MKSNYKSPVIETMQVDRFERCYAATNSGGCELCRYGVDVKSLGNSHCRYCNTIIFGDGNSLYYHCEQA